MALINCPNCKKKISDKAKSCSHCQLDIGNMDEEKLHTMRQVSLIKASERLMTHSMIAMLLFCGGVFWLWQDGTQNSWQYYAAAGTTVAGFILYIVTRFRIVLLKKSRKS
ncbi:hypothetical protein J7384_09220 [Endozoicomonas sp. G2_1]|uniref:zinc ribbon domain-containing protein n=1 Tax=Endozoicomonas sp. G2_1 TaxID=2821091 RepID=UPI001AD95CD9|nr:hypothetical protein [Endozoicomonas sp. G2_1]MBO9490543.1 hypothetical protein [Endozoicomonas sp. G2_1]